MFSAVFVYANGLHKLCHTRTYYAFITHFIKTDKNMYKQDYWITEKFLENSGSTLTKLVILQNF